MISFTNNVFINRIYLTLELCLEVSVIIPLYNREKFIEQLFNTLKNQKFKNFEIILIDDGSIDRTKENIEKFFLNSSLDYRYIFQKNNGCYGARNAGLEIARGKYIALFDSDDEWPEYHLEDFYTILEKNSDIDWVFGSIERISHDSGDLLEKTNFYIEGKKPHPIIGLSNEERIVSGQSVYVINDKKLPETVISYTIPGSMQCTLIRRDVFKDNLFDDTFRTAYDRFYCMLTAMRGFTFAYVNKTHLIYHVHDENISTVNDASAQKMITSGNTMLRGYNLIREQATNVLQKKAAKSEISRVLAWELAVNNQTIGNYKLAVNQFKLAVALQPFNFWYTKSFVLAIVKYIYFDFILKRR